MYLYARGPQTNPNVKSAREYRSTLGIGVVVVVVVYVDVDDDDDVGSDHRQHCQTGDGEEEEEGGEGGGVEVGSDSGNVCSVSVCSFLLLRSTLCL